MPTLPINTELNISIIVDPATKDELVAQGYPRDPLDLTEFRLDGEPFMQMAMPYHEIVEYNGQTITSDMDADPAIFDVAAAGGVVLVRETHDSRFFYVTNTEPEPVLNSFQIDATPATFDPGQSSTLSAINVDEPDYPLNVAYSSSDSSTVTVSGNTAEGVKPGSVSITGTDAESGITSTVDLTVSVPQVQSFTVNSTDTDLVIGDTATLSVSNVLPQYSVASVTYSSSDSAVISVSGNTIAAESDGSATITGTDADGATSTIVINSVLPQVQSFAIASTATTLLASESATLSIEDVLPAGAVADVTYESSDIGSVTVSGNTIEAVSEGSATITGTDADGATATIDITVDPDPAQ